MNTRQKMVGFAVLCSVLFIGIGCTTADDSTGNTIKNSVTIATEDRGTVIMNDGAENVSTNNNQAWLVEWYTYDEYRAFVEEQKEALSRYIGMKGGYYDRDGTLRWFIWTPEMVDTVIEQHERTLEDIKNGVKVSKSVNGDTNVRFSFTSTPIGTEVVVTVILENGERIYFGPYDTQEKCHAAIKAYFDEQVKEGIMTQQKADKILMNLG
jgi:hypothetical protein